MPRKRTGYDAACYYDGKLLGRCTKADSDAYTLLMNACGGDAAQVLREYAYFPRNFAPYWKMRRSCRRTGTGRRNVPCAEKFPVGRGAEL